MKVGILLWNWNKAPSYLDEKYIYEPLMENIIGRNKELEQLYKEPGILNEIKMARKHDYL